MWRHLDCNTHINSSRLSESGFPLTLFRSSVLELLVLLSWNHGRTLYCYFSGHLFPIMHLGSFTVMNYFILIQTTCIWYAAGVTLTKADHGSHLLAFGKKKINFYSHVNIVTLYQMTITSCEQNTNTNSTSANSKKLQHYHITWRKKGESTAVERQREQSEKYF